MVGLVKKRATIIHLQFGLSAKANRDLLSFLRLGLRRHLKETTLGDDAPEAIRGREATDTASALEGHWENIGLDGTHGSVSCREVS